MAWALYVLVVSALLSGAAAAAEAALRGRGAGTRWVWLAALAASPLLPVLGWLGVSAGGAIPVLPPLMVGLPTSPPVGGLRVGVAGHGVAMALDGALLASWALATLLVLLWLGVSLLRLRRERAGWRRGVLQGVSVWISPRAGPAALGGLPGAIVVPQWALALDPGRQRLMLRHESEHLRAGDPWVLLGGLLCAAALPWSLLAWWQLSRLRLAVERDCDARVLAAEGDRRAYGELLLEVGRRRSSPPLPAAALGEPRSYLEQRLEAMLAARRSSRARLAALLAGAAALVVLAVCAEGPTSPAARQARAPEARLVVPGDSLDSAPLTPYTTPPADRPTFTPFTVAPDLLNRAEVVEALQRYYPPLLKDAGIGGTVNVWFYIDATGRVVNTKIQKSSGQASLDAAALKVADVMRFTSALNGARKVAVWVALPIVFRSDATRAGGAASVDSVLSRHLRGDGLRRDPLNALPRDPRGTGERVLIAG